MLSLAFAGLCLAAMIASFQHVRRWGFSTLHMRYTLVVNHGKLLVRGSVPPAKEDAHAWDLLKRVRNEDVQWDSIWMLNPDGRAFSWAISPTVKFNSPAWQLSQLTSASDQPLLRGLDGEQKFVAAHVLLAQRHNMRSPTMDAEHSSGTFVLAGYENLWFRLNMPPPQLAPWGLKTIRIPEGKLALAPRQLSAIRDMWHDALDRTFLSIQIWWLIALGMIVPLLQYRRFRRRLYRQRAGRCLSCGYDLRASSGVCPECGDAIVQRASIQSGACNG